MQESSIYASGASNLEPTFISISPSTLAEEQLQNTQLARSYTARYNRFGRRKGFPSQSTPSDEESSSRSITPEFDQFQHVLAAPPLTLFSPFGGLSCSFDSSDTSRAMQVADTVFNRLYTRDFHAHEISAIFRKFCQSPVVFYAYAYMRLFVKKAMQGLTEREDSIMLLHSTKGSTLLRQMLDDLREEDIEPALLAMVNMPRLRSSASNEASKLPTHGFRPYQTSSELVNALRQAEVFFLPAARILIGRKGGLQNLQTPGLAKILIGTDISQASDSFAPFVFAGLLQDHLPMRDLSKDLNGHGIVTGDGFDNLIPGGLPSRARVLFKNLSILDRMLSQHHMSAPKGRSSFSDQSSEWFTTTRNFLHYQLLSLPSCQVMDASDQRQCSIVVYECCRLAALLYFNAAMRLTPQSAGRGIDEPVRLLRILIPQSQYVSAVTTAEDASAWYLWVLFIGGIGALRSTHWEFFVRMSAVVSERYKINSLQSVVERVQRFLWSDDVCGEAAVVLWEAAQRERQGLRNSGWINGMVT